MLPIYIQGAADILPPGTKFSQPASVLVRIGHPIRFAEGTNIGEAKHIMEDSRCAPSRTPATSQQAAACVGDSPPLGRLFARTG